MTNEPVVSGIEAHPAQGTTNQPEGPQDIIVDEKTEQDHSVPTELLDLHVQLEEAGVTPEEFKEVFNAEASDQSGVEGEGPEVSDPEGT